MNNKILGVYFLGKKFSKSTVKRLTSFLPEFIEWLKNDGNKNSTNYSNIYQIKNIVLEYSPNGEYEKILIEWITFFENNKKLKTSDSVKTEIIKLFQKSCPRFNLDINIFYKECLTCKNKFPSTKALYNKKFCSNDCLNISVNNRNSGTKFIILSRDNYRCIYCGATPILNEVKLVLDHIVPWVKGGLNTSDNLVTCCTECNSGKKDNKLNNFSFKEIKEEVCKRNLAQKIPNNKIIKGSHER